MIQSADYIRILPELILVIAGILVMIVEPTLGEHDDRREDRREDRDDDAKHVDHVGDRRVERQGRDDRPHAP